VRRLAWLAALAACGGGAAKKGPAAPAAAKVHSPAEIAELALPSVVLIKTPAQLGTGFVVWKDGRIATSLHVLVGAKEATVVLNDGREFKDITVLGADPAHDLAIIRVGANDLKPLPLGDSAAVKPGERVVAIGHPMGLGNTISDGLVSGVREIHPQVTLLQITAPIAPGSSGGPIFNERAEVIGVATLFSSEGQNLNFGVPVSYLKPLLLSEKPMPLATFARDLDTMLLEGCTGDEVRLVVKDIADALSVGVPLYNKGDHQGCFDTYQAAALKMVGQLKGCPRVRETLLAGVASANRKETPSEKAWAMRHAFDRVLNAFDAAVERIEKDRAKPTP
jgi:serine protease Do